MKFFKKHDKPNVEKHPSAYIAKDLNLLLSNKIAKQVETKQASYLNDAEVKKILEDAGIMMSNASKVIEVFVKYKLISDHHRFEINGDGEIERKGHAILPSVSTIDLPTYMAYRKELARTIRTILRAEESSKNLHDAMRHA